MEKAMIQPITHKSIRPYGYIIDAACVEDEGSGNSYGILLKEKSDGWRIGYLIVRDNEIKQVQCHRTSLETFEPVKGEAIIALATPDNPEELKFFLLNKPIVLRKGVWHEVAAWSGRCEIKICENIEVDSEDRSLNKPINVVRDLYFSL